MHPIQSHRPKRPLHFATATVLVAAVAMIATAATYTTSEDPQVTGLLGWTPKPLFTVGETVGAYTPVGILDGLGAQKLNKNVVRVYSTHELGNSVGYEYSLANGTKLKGARISYFDIDRHTRELCGAGMAYDTVYDRFGNVVVAASQINEVGNAVNGFSRFCSSAFYNDGEYGFRDDIFFTGEETSNGSQWALDVRRGEIWACPELGRGGWENVSAVDTGCKNTIGLLMGDDVQEAPLYLWIGVKKKHGNFIERNGLTEGQLYCWVAQNGDSTPQQFNALGDFRAGRFVPVDARNSAMAGMPGHDAQGYLNDTTLRSAAWSLGAFHFSRPEDIHTNPDWGQQAVFASTGRGSIFPADDWGTIYIVDMHFKGCKGKKGHDLPDYVPASLEILASADALPVPDAGIRNPDNLTWARDGYIYVQEDRSVENNVFGGVTGREASIWRLDPNTGAIARIAEIDRSAVVPAGLATDPVPGDIGNWETSGIIDVTNLFPRKRGERLLLIDVQAHSVTDGVIGGSSRLVQGGQLILMSKSGKKYKDDDCRERNDDEDRWDRCDD